MSTNNNDIDEISPAAPRTGDGTTPATRRPQIVFPSRLGSTLPSINLSNPQVVLHADNQDPLNQPNQAFDNSEIREELARTGHHQQDILAFLRSMPTHTASRQSTSTMPTISNSPRPVARRPIATARKDPSKRTPVIKLTPQVFNGSLSGWKDFRFMFEKLIKSEGCIDVLQGSIQPTDQNEFDQWYERQEYVETYLGMCCSGPVKSLIVNLPDEILDRGYQAWMSIKRHLLASKDATVMQLQAEISKLYPTPIKHEEVEKYITRIMALRSQLLDLDQSTPISHVMNTFFRNLPQGPYEYYLSRSNHEKLPDYEFLTELTSGIIARSQAIIQRNLDRDELSQTKAFR